MRYRNIEDFNEEYRGQFLPDQRRYGEPLRAERTLRLSGLSDAFTQPAKSKLANALFAKQLQKQFSADGVPITVMAVHPGWVYTEGVAEKEPTLSIPVLGPVLRVIYKATFKTTEEGAYSTVFSAASSAVREDRARYQGAFIMPDRKQGGVVAKPPASQAESEELAQELWSTTEEILNGLGL